MWYVIDTCLMMMKTSECSQFSVEFMDGTSAVFTIKLLVYDESQKEIWDLSSSEKYEYALCTKELATESFGSKEYILAAEKYSLILKLLLSVNGDVEEDHDHKLVLVRLNLALCFMKLNIPDGVIYHTDAVLSIIGDHEENVKKISTARELFVKTLYRRAWAFCAINEFEKCREDLNKLFLVDSDNSAALQLKSSVDKKNRDSDRQMSSNLRGIFS